MNAPIRLATTCCLVVALTGGVAQAQMASAQLPAPAPPPSRSDGWNTATNIFAVSSLALELVLPRVFYSDPEVTTGWKARWHVSALAPIMTLTTLALFNEQSLKSAFAGSRPGCTSEGTANCTSYGFMSTQAFAAGSALGYGAGVFLVDTIRWSGGSVNAGALIGEVGIPLILAPLTALGRTSGNWESPGQAWGSAVIGLGVGLAMGALYSSLQRPECGYTGNLICW